MKNKASVIEHLRTTPVVQIACQKSGISRATYYRWREEDEEFKQKTDQAIEYGNFFINDLAESQLITLIKEKNLMALIYWLNHHHPTYSEKKLFLSKADQQELFKNIISSNTETAFQSLINNVIQGKMPKFFIHTLRSIINNLNQSRRREIEDKKIELLSKISSSRK